MFSERMCRMRFQGAKVLRTGTRDKGKYTRYVQDLVAANGGEGLKGS